MNALSPAKQFSRYLIIALTLAFLSACSSQLTDKERPPALFSELNNNSAFFLKRADEVSKQRSLAWQFVALQALIAENKPTIANSVIEYLQSQPLTAMQQSELKLLTAQNLTLQRRPSDALIVLDNLDSQLLSELGLIHFLKLQIKLQIDKQAHIDATNNLLLLIPLIQPADEIQAYHDLLFSQLLLLPAELLDPTQSADPIDEQQAVKETDTDSEIPLDLEADITQPEADITQPDVPANLVKQGWYQLASLYQRYQLRPNQLIRSIADWQLQYPAHPAISVMPTQLTNLPELSPYQPENIAVLLPLSGRFKQQGQAIQYGLLHAYYEQQQQLKETSSNATLHFFDTQLQSMEEIAAQLKKQRIDFVIGPLLKSNVEAFLPFARKIPVLALNRFPKPMFTEKAAAVSKQATQTDPETAIPEQAGQLETPENKKVAWHYAFPLSPEEEARQAARFIFSQAHQKPLLIAPDSAYGLRIADAFNQEWERLDQGELSSVESYFFDKNAQLAPFIAQALQTEKSKRRIDQMKMITRLPLKTKLRSRRDIDAIYIIGQRDELLMIKAFIDVSISPFAKTIPLYASSRSHLHDNHNKELTSVTFSDSPFLLNDNNKDFKAIEKAWGKESLTALRLFALGFDSYQLIEQLIQLQNNADNHYRGLVGQLSLDPGNTVQAQLNWAKYQRGELIEITAPIAAE